MSWNLHPFHLVDSSSENAHIISTESTYTSATEKKKKRKVKGLAAKRQISENAKQSEIWPRVRRVTQWTEKSPFLSQCNNITNLFGGVMYFEENKGRSRHNVEGSFLFVLYFGWPNQPSSGIMIILHWYVIFMLHVV